MSATLVVEPIPSRLARETVEREHYMHRKPMTTHSFGLLRGGVLAGVVTFGVPASRHLQAGVCPSDPSLVLELNRLWVTDHLPKNTESWFVSRVLKQMPPRLIVSYADTAQGHLGYVYRAMNFRYAGWTDMERKTPRFDYIPLDPTAHTRESSRSGVKERVRRKPKVRYWTATGTRPERARLVSLCGWQSLDWTELPPPIEHKQHSPKGVGR